MERKKEKKIINLPESIDLDDTEQNKRANEKQYMQNIYLPKGTLFFSKFLSQKI